MTKQTKNQDRRYFLSLAKDSRVQAHTISLLASALISLW